MIEFDKAPMTFSHLGRKWTALWVDTAWFARDDKGNDTGPFRSRRDAVDWVKAIVP